MLRIRWGLCGDVSWRFRREGEIGRIESRTMEGDERKREGLTVVVRDCYLNCP